MTTDKNRRAAERRRLQRQMERRKQQAERRKRINIIVSIVAVLVVIGGVVALIAGTTGSDDNNTAASEPPVSTTPVPSSSAAKPAYPCTWQPDARSASKKVSVPATTTPPKTGTVVVSVTTSQGPMTFTLNRAKAPCAVASFLSLAQQKYFDSTPCHRLTTGPTLYVLQCGDPTGKGTGGPGYSFGDELTGTEQYTQGVLAMANSGPDTNGSQFFIVYKNSQLQPSYTVFGSVTKGLDVVTKVAAKGATGGTGDGAPALPITLTRVSAAA